MLAYVYKLIGAARGDDESADAGMEDRCQLCSQQPNPSEPPTVDCDTCIEPTPVTMMVTCDAEGNCSYAQCLSCVIKCGASGCPDPACMYLQRADRVQLVERAQLRLEVNVVLVAFLHAHDL